MVVQELVAVAMVQEETLILVEAPLTQLVAIVRRVLAAEAAVMVEILLYKTGQ